MYTLVGGEYPPSRELGGEPAVKSFFSPRVSVEDAPSMSNPSAIVYVPRTLIQTDPFSLINFNAQVPI